MTDRDVIWVKRHTKDGGVWGHNAWTQGTRPYTPLKRATQLQQAMTVIAEGLEELAGDMRSQKTNDWDTLEAVDWQAKQARKALTEFERTKG